MRRLVATLGVVLLVSGILVGLLLPPRAIPLGPPAWTPAWPEARGAYHVHSNRSDGSGTVDEIAAAAARAGLDFVILTDHGDGTRPPDPPAYRHGVLLLDGVEISTSDGHYVALGLDRAAPYPLAGTAAAVIEDVRRLGGIGFAAHPGSPKPSLAWQAWDEPFDGVEWLNADSEWRDEIWRALGRALVTYPFRPRETLAAMIDRPDAVLSAWDRVARTRRVPALAGADAHARLGLRATTDPYDDRILLRVPAYHVSFGVFTNHVLLDAPFTGNAASDAAALVDAVAHGRSYTVIDGLAGPGRVEFRGTSGVGDARPGEYLDFDGPATIEARLVAPPGTRLAILRDGVPVHETVGDHIRLVAGEVGAYRLEARLAARHGGRDVPWVLTNPIYVGLREIHERLLAGRATPAPPGERRAVDLDGWQAEADDASASSATVAGDDEGMPRLEWRFALAGGAPTDQYAALRFPANGPWPASARLHVRATADRPMRLWIQARADHPSRDERWGRSVYLDGEDRHHIVPLETLRPMESRGAALDPGRIDSLLLVVYTLNTPPGTAGRVTIHELAVEKGPAPFDDMR